MPGDTIELSYNVINDQLPGENLQTSSFNTYLGEWLIPDLTCAPTAKDIPFVYFIQIANVYMQAF